MPGALASLQGGSGSEPKIEPAAQDVARERYVIAGQGPAAEAAIDVAKVDVEILGFCSPGSEEPDLEPGADSPAEIGVILANEAWRVRADIADGETAGHIGHEAVEGVADAAAHGGEPRVAGLAAGRAERKRMPLDVGPVDVAFHAEHESADLPVVARGQAQEAAREVEVAGRIPGRRAPAAAAVKAEIEAG